MNKKQRENNLLPNGIPRWIRCYDNGGESVDQYTIVFTGNYSGREHGCNFRVMSTNPYCPAGVGLWCAHTEIIDALNGKWPPAIGRKNHLGTRIKFQDLPPDCQKLVLQDYKELWVLEGIV